MKNRVIVALNMSSLSVSAKLNKARLIRAGIAANAATFANPNPPLAALDAAINNLDAAITDASDGGKNKTALMHDKEDELLRQFTILASYVTEVANGDIEIIHLAGMEEKKKPVVTQTDFDVQQGDVSGSVDLRSKPQPKTIYKWQYCADPLNANNWVSAHKTDQAKTTITNLPKGIYWFRVVFCDAGGDHEQAAVSFAVN